MLLLVLPPVRAIAQVPVAPTNLSATIQYTSAGYAYVQLNWSAAAGATYYDIYRVTTTTATPPAASAVNDYYSTVTTTSTKNTASLTPSTYYAYCIRARNSSGTGGPSNVVVALTPPAAPTGLTPTIKLVQNPTTGYAYVQLNWGPVTGATYYNVYRGSASGAETLYAQARTNSYVDANADRLGTPVVYYYVKACNAGVSIKSGEVSATLPTVPSSLAFSSLTVNAGNELTGTVTLSFPAPAGGAVVTLSSANPAVVSVPAAVTVPAGQTSATFSANTYAVTANTSVTVTASLNGLSASATLTVNGPVVVGLTFAPSAVPFESTGTVTISFPVPTGGAVVSLTSANTSVVTVPATVTVPAGQTSATFTASTYAVTANTSVTVTASLNGLSASATLTVNPYTLSLTFLKRLVDAGQSSTGIVNILSAAPAGGAVVTLTSNSPAVVVPASVRVPAGKTQAEFTAYTYPVDSETPVTVTASLSGVSDAATLTVDPTAVVNLEFNPSAVPIEEKSIGTVEISYFAPAGGAVVTLTSNSAAVSVPASVTVPARQTSATFTADTSAVTAPTSAIVTASLNTTTGVQATVTVAPIAVVYLTFVPWYVQGGQVSTGTVTISYKAPSGGIVVSLSSANTSVVSVPATVTVPAGQTQAEFTASTYPVVAETPVFITASFDGVSVISPLTVESPSATTLMFDPTEVASGQQSTGTVTISAPAPAGGAIVSLESDTPAVVTVPASVSVPAGETQAEFTATTSALTAATGVFVTADLNGKTALAYLRVVPTNVPTNVIGLAFSPSTVTGGEQSTGTVTIFAPAPADGTVVTLVNVATDVVTIPATVTVPAGQTSASFTATTHSVASTIQVVVPAVLNTTTYGTLTVSPPAPPPAPQNVSATEIDDDADTVPDTATEVELNWPPNPTPLPGVEGQANILKGEDPSDETLFATVPDTGSYVDTSVKPGQIVYYEVEYEEVLPNYWDEVSPPSYEQAVKILPPAPKGLTAIPELNTDGTLADVKLGWTPDQLYPGGTITVYRTDVTQGPDQANPPPLTQYDTGPDNGAYTNTNSLVGGNAYEYEITDTIDGMESPPSYEANASTPPPPPYDVTAEPEADANGNWNVYVNWAIGTKQVVSSAVYYWKLYRWATGGTPLLYDLSDVPDYNNTNNIDETQDYSYAVSAEGVDGVEGPMSPPVTVSFYNQVHVAATDLPTGQLVDFQNKFSGLFLNLDGLNGGPAAQQPGDPLISWTNNTDINSLFFLIGNPDGTYSIRCAYSGLYVALLGNLGPVEQSSTPFEWNFIPYDSLTDYNIVPAYENGVYLCGDLQAGSLAFAATQTDLDTYLDGAMAQWHLALAPAGSDLPASSTTVPQAIVCPYASTEDYLTGMNVEGASESAGAPVIAYPLLVGQPNSVFYVKQQGPFYQLKDSNSGNDVGVDWNSESLVTTADPTDPTTLWKFTYAGSPNGYPVWTITCPTATSSYTNVDISNASTGWSVLNWFMSWLDYFNTCIDNFSAVLNSITNSSWFTLYSNAKTTFTNLLNSLANVPSTQPCQEPGAPMILYPPNGQGNQSFTVFPCPTVSN